MKNICFNPISLIYRAFILFFTILSIFTPIITYAGSNQGGYTTANIDKKGTVVAIIDTGINYSHDRLKDYMWTNKEEIVGDGIDNDGNGYIDDVYGWNFYSNSNIIYNDSNKYDDHGTHSAGILVNYLLKAEVSNVQIMSIKVLGGKNRKGTIKNLIKAVKYAEDMGASICNISLGTTYNDLSLKKTIRDSDMLFVTAAGNGRIGSNIDKIPIYPSSYTMKNIISVANITSDSELHKTSNYGKVSVDIGAEGTKIYSTLTHNNYGTMTGTSMATLQVTGTIAVIYSLYPDITIVEVKESIINSATMVDTLDNKVVAGGKLDFENVLDYVQYNIMKE